VAVGTAAASIAAASSAEPAPPSGTAAASTSEPEPADPSGARARLSRALRTHDVAAAEVTFLDLAEHDPAAFRDPEVAAAARDLTVALERAAKGDRVFEALTDHLGPAGLDVLYDLVATKGRAGAALRAVTILRRKGMLARASPEMRIAFELREASCVDKMGLLDRAVADGDARALVVLSTQGVGCFKKNNRALQEAMTALRARLHRGQ
jgi:hypothetical protein